MKFKISIILALCIAASPFAMAQQSNLELASRYSSLYTLPNFRVVKPFLLRGGQPEPSDFAKLKQCGVKTVIDLRNEPTIVAEEAQRVRAWGMSFVNIPLNEFNTPPEQEVKEFLKVVSTPESGPFYVHCQHGQDRTGAMIGIYRINNDGWTADQAYAEMVACGFHPFYAALSRCVFSWQHDGRPVNPPSGYDIVVDLKRRFDHFVKKQ